MKPLLRKLLLPLAVLFAFAVVLGAPVILIVNFLRIVLQ